MKYKDKHIILIRIIKWNNCTYIFSIISQRTNMFGIVETPQMKKQPSNIPRFKITKHTNRICSNSNTVT